MKFGQSGRSVVNVELSATVEEVVGMRVVHLRVTEASVVSWTLGLCMLKERLVEALSVSTEGGSFKLKVEADLKGARDQIQFGGRSFSGEIAISEVELDRWMHFFLCFLRDGYAPVDHLDVELDSPADPTLDDVLVLHVPYAAPAMYGHASR